MMNKNESVNKKTVLIIDDEPLSVKLLCHQLEEDYTVIVAHGGREALEGIPRTLPDIILLDLIMPDMDGYEVYRAIRLMPALDSVPVLFITVMSDVECETAGLEMGAHDFIHKPFVADLVRLRINNHLAFSQQRSLLARRSEQLQELNRKLEEEIALHRVETLMLKQMERTLSESEERFRTVMEKIPNIAVQGYALDGTVLFWNRASERLYDFTAEEAMGANLLNLIIPPEMKDGVAAAIRMVKESGEPIPAGELLLMKKDGTRVPVFSSHALVSPVGRQRELFCLDIDLSEQKEVEKERQRLELQYYQAQKMESLGILTGGIAHDFNNILTVILGHCFLAREELIPVDEYLPVFRKVEVAAERAAELCRQMLTYAGKSPLEQTRLSLWLLVDEVVRMLQSALKKNVVIALDLQPDLPEINGDSGQLQQIVMNLIINASEAIGDINGTIRVTLSRTFIAAEQTETDTFGTIITPGTYVTLEVSDTGSGMDEETQKRIFEPFFTTKSTGRGLGMSAICGIITSHAAFLNCASTRDVGTTFRVSFPVPVAVDNDAPVAVVSAEDEKTGGTILLVDDEEILRSMGETLLEALGFSTITAQDGCEALEIYRSRGSGIDIVLLDLVMPVMGGIETYHELRGINPLLPIIIYSGFDEDSVEEVIKHDPRTGFVHKPYKPEALRKIMIRMMQNCCSSRT
jgi:PAS domain S-box-containing protein